MTPSGVFAAADLAGSGSRTKRSIKNGMVPPPCEKMNLMSGQREAVPVNSRLAIVREVSVPYSMIGAGTPAMRLRQQFAAGRMGEDDRLAPIELVHHRRKGGIAEPFVAVAREQPDAVGLERVERIVDLAQAARRRSGSGRTANVPKRRGPIGGKLGAVFVAGARECRGRGTHRRTTRRA